MQNTHTTDSPSITWEEDGVVHSAIWRSEKGLPPPKRVQVVKDTLTADSAYRLACEGVGLLWQSDFQNAKQLLLALARRIDHKPVSKKRKPKTDALAPCSPVELFHRHRLAQSQRARTLGSILLRFEGDYTIALRRAPDVQLACEQAWGTPEGEPCVASLRDLLGMLGAFEWRKKGVEVLALGGEPVRRIYPHYGVFSPVRSDYIELLAQCPLPKAVVAGGTVFDVGTGSGVLSAVLAFRGAQTVVATDTDPRAVACAQSNIKQLGLSAQVKIKNTDLFPEGHAALVVCNPPWIPARPASPLERAVYDEGGQMLKAYVAGLTGHLSPGGEGWLILSNMAELLGLRSRDALLESFNKAGLRVLERHDAKAQQGKAWNPDDTLFFARSAEVVSIWRLGLA